MNQDNPNEVDRIVFELCSVLGCSFVGLFEKVELLEGRNVIELVTRFLWHTDDSHKALIPSYLIPINIGDKIEFVNRIADLLKRIQINTDYHVLMHGRTAEIKNLCIALVEKLPTKCINGPLFEILHDFFSISDVINSDGDALASRYIRRQLPHLRSEVPENVSMNCLLCNPRANDSRDEIINILNGPFRRIGDVHSPPKRVKPIVERSSSDSDENDENFALGGQPRQRRQGDQLSPSSDIEFQETVDQVVEDLIKVGRYDPSDHTQLINILEEEIEEKDSLLKSLEHNRNFLFLEIGSLRNYKENNDELFHKFKYSEDADKQANTLLCDFWVHEVEMKQRWTAILNENLSQINDLKKKESYLLKQPILEDIAKIEEQIRNMTDVANIREDALPLMKKIIKVVPENCTTREHMYERLDEVRENYNKQVDSLKKIQTDIDLAKKELAWLAESLLRSFNIIEEELAQFCDVLKGEESYRMFAQVNKSCIDSIDTVKSSGDLEQELERVKQRCIQIRNTSKPNDLSTDIEAIREDNDGLENVLNGVLQERKLKRELKRKHSPDNEDYERGYEFHEDDKMSDEGNCPPKATDSMMGDEMDIADNGEHGINHE